MAINPHNLQPPKTGINIPDWTEARSSTLGGGAGIAGTSPKWQSHLSHAAQSPPPLRSRPLIQSGGGVWGEMRIIGALKVTLTHGLQFVVPLSLLLCWQVACSSGSASNTSFLLLFCLPQMLGTEQAPGLINSYSTVSFPWVEVNCLEMRSYCSLRK